MNIEKILYGELTNKIIEDIDDVIEKTLNDTFSNSTCTSASAITSEPFTYEKLIEAQKLLEPYNDLKRSIYECAIPELHIKFDDNEEDDKLKWNWFSSYGMRVIKPTKTITVLVQKRRHRCRRINKKWAKRYGYIEVKKEVPDYGFITIGAV